MCKVFGTVLYIKQCSKNSSQSLLLEFKHGMCGGVLLTGGDNCVEHEEDKIQRPCCFPGPSPVLTSLSRVLHSLLSSWLQGWVSMYSTWSLALHACPDDFHSHLALTFYLLIIFSPLYILASFVKDKVSIGTWIYLWAFYFFPLIYISVFVPGPHCLDDCIHLLFTYPRKHNRWCSMPSKHNPVTLSVFNLWQNDQFQCDWNHL